MIYFSIRRPATRKLWLIPTTLLWARWAVPKASLTKQSPNWLSWFLNYLTFSGSALTFLPDESFILPSSSMWNRTFSHKNISLLEFLTLLITDYPTQSYKKVILLLSSCSSNPVIGFKECFGFRWPLGRPRWDSITKDLGLCFKIYWIVGIVAKYNDIYLWLSLGQRSYHLWWGH